MNTQNKCCIRKIDRLVDRPTGEGATLKNTPNAPGPYLMGGVEIWVEEDEENQTNSKKSAYGFNHEPGYID